MTKEQIKCKWQKEIDIVLDGEKDLLEFPDLEYDLFQYFLSEMPHGIAKARDGDPSEWIFAKLDEFK